MIVRSFDDITGTNRDIITPNWRSKRIILARDGAGFSLHETIVRAGTVNSFWYASHIEAVVILEGHGQLIDEDNDVAYELRPGMIYLLNGHEHHRLLPATDIRAICVFNPPVTGAEIHDESGAYPLIAD